MKNYRPSLPETQDKRPLGSDLDISYCLCHAMSMIKLSRSQLMAPWAAGSIQGQGEKFSA